MKHLNRTTAGLAKRYPIRVLQFGGGNFLRAFIDWMIQEMNEQADFQAGVVVVKPTQQGDYADYQQQEGLFHVVLDGYENGQLVHRLKLVDCVQQVVHPYHEYDAFLQLADNPDLRFIISNTTEAGISFQEEPQPQNQVAQSFPGKLTSLLYRRYQSTQGDTTRGFIILPCELIERNGEQLQTAILQYAQHWQLEPAFAEWVNTANLFCNTIVDRIVPGYPKDREKELQEEIGFKDTLLVAAEPYHLLAIEAGEQVQREFPARKAGLNVVFTKNIEQYQARKVRILNGAHTAMVFVGYLYGLRTVRRTIEDELIGQYIEELIQEEIIPALQTEGTTTEELQAYAQEIIDRFRNPFIKHQLSSIALNSTTKFRTRLLPTLLDYVAKYQTLPERVVFALAALVCFYKGNWQGSKMPLQDEEVHLRFFKKLWDKYEHDTIGMAKQVLHYETLWQQNLSKIPKLDNKLAEFIEEISSKGMAQALQDLL